MNQAKPLWLSESNLALAADLYQLTMMAGYRQVCPERQATFELFVRRLPPGRACLIACGLEQVVHYLQNLHFEAEQIDFLRGLPTFAQAKEEFWQYLQSFTFMGELWAIPEGTPIFANQPILRVRGSITETQLIESYLLSVINAQTIVASKAAKVVQAACGKPVFEFGLRRAHGPQAAIAAARAAYIAGFAGTSNVVASELLQIPVVGTMAHSWVMSFTSEEVALKRFRQIYPQAALLIDTYDTTGGAKLACQTGPHLSSVRIDSGDLLAQSKSVRAILDANDQGKTTIQVSGDLNEEIIAGLERDSAPIDIYALGTELVVSRDAPSLSLVYKLVAVKDGADGWMGVAKASEGKQTLACAKQIYRQIASDGSYSKDIVAVDNEEMAGQALLQKIMEGGKLVGELPGLDQIRAYCASAKRALGSDYFQIIQNDQVDSKPPQYTIELSRKLADAQKIFVH
jgi:nicotinate phosphoribosyltransferase